MTQEKRSKETIAKILKAAETCLAQKGFSDTGVEDICQQAGVTKGAFYHHFKTKQQLFLELLDHWIDKVSLDIDPRNIDSKNTLELLLNMPDKISPAFATASGQLPVFLELYIRGLREEELKNISKRSYKRFIEFFTSIQKKYNENVGEEEDISKILFSLTIGFLIQGLLNPRGDDWVALAKKSISMLLS